ncbi:hypothetical protein, partial [Streptomyces sp. NPDC096030]|uniref:hypothetical protein n=1 Tax=Streptomyces sp. NPDC096030 TaxID=3155423 RepID=UPI00333480DF
GRFTTPDPAPQHNRYQAMNANPITNIDPDGTTEIPDWGSWLIMGLTLAAGIITTAISLGTAAGPAALGITIAGAVLDLASYTLEATALATGHSQINDPLNIAALTLGAIGVTTGIGAALWKPAKAAATHLKHLSEAWQQRRKEALLKQAWKATGKALTGARMYSAQQSKHLSHLNETAYHNHFDWDALRNLRGPKYSLTVLPDRTQDFRITLLARSWWHTRYRAAWDKWNDVLEIMPEQQVVAKKVTTALKKLFDDLDAAYTELTNADPRGNAAVVWNLQPLGLTTTKQSLASTPKEWEKLPEYFASLQQDVK